MGLTGLILLLGLLAVVMVLIVMELLNTGKIIRLVGPDVLEVFVKVLGVVPAAISVRFVIFGLQKLGGMPVVVGHRCRA